MRFHTTRFALFTSSILGLVCSLTCDETRIIDQIWFVEYTVSNQTSVDVTVRAGSYFRPTPQVHVPAQSRKRLLYYEEFLGPTPDAGRTFTCVSVYRDSDSVLVFQLAPVSNSQWTLNRQAEFQHQYILELTDAKLHKNGIQSRCGEITGVVMDSLSTLPLQRYHVRACEDVPRYEPCMDATVMPTGHYFLMWHGKVPAGGLEFSAPGHQCRKLRIPTEIDSVAAMRYEANMSLPRLPLPEDSLRWGYCPPGNQ